MRSFLRKRVRSPNPCLAGVALFALSWSSLAFCSEIHDAAMMGDLAKVRALLKNDPNLVFSKDNNGWTPLHWAVVTGHYEVAELLLANKAEVNAKDDGGGTPLHWAALPGHKDVAELLLANKADVNVKDNNGRTPLHDAADGSSLLDPSAPVPYSAADAATLAAGAVECSEVVELLLANKAGVNVKDKDGMTPLHYAAFRGHAHVAALLLANKADVNAKDNKGRTPLHWAVGQGQKDTAELLLNNKAEVNAKDNDGKAPLDAVHSIFVSDQTADKITELLRQHGGHE